MCSQVRRACTLADGRIQGKSQRGRFFFQKSGEQQLGARNPEGVEVHLGGCREEEGGRKDTCPHDLNNREKIERRPIQDRLGVSGGKIPRKGILGGHQQTPGGMREFSMKGATKYLRQ